jgi:DNA-binding NarL/FixJ family response regulator
VEIIKSHPGQKAVIVSWFSESEGVVRAQQFGVGVFIKKSCTIQQLGQVMPTVLSVSGHRVPNLSTIRLAYVCLIRCAILLGVSALLRLPAKISGTLQPLTRRG